MVQRRPTIRTLLISGFFRTYKVVNKEILNPIKRLPVSPKKIVADGKLKIKKPKMPASKTRQYCARYISSVK
jgi:hypothetical protein